MKPTTMLLILVALICAATTLPAQAASRTWVSGTSGNDANPCTRALPCATFAAAYTATDAFGEINCIDAGSFGVLTIQKSITISCEAGTAGILAPLDNGITVNMLATDVVYLRGLDINGLGPNPLSRVGIAMFSPGTLHVEKCLIHGFVGSNSSFQGFGILAQPNGTGALFVADTVVTDNGTAANGGNIIIEPTSSSVVNVSLERVQMTNGTVGLRADGTDASPLRVSVTDSQASGNIYNGFFAKTTNGKVTMMIQHSIAANNGANGARADGALAKLVLGESVISGNVTGVSTANGGTLLSYQDNRIDLNGTDGWPVTSLALH